MPVRLWHSVHTHLFQRKEGSFPALDGLRAIAALQIVSFHAAVWLTFGLPRSAAGVPLAVRWVFFTGWVGVDVFFVLSGFLIGRMLFLQLLAGTIRFKAFYIRRTFRIFPAYYVVLTASVLLFARLDSFRRLYEGAPWEPLLHRSWANYLYVSNYLYGLEVPNALSWAWSLCIEEHFYLVLPATLALLFRFSRAWGRWVVLVALALVPLASRLVIFLRAPEHTVPIYWIYPESHTHFDGLLFGVLIAYAYVYQYERFSRLVARLRALCWIAAVGCFAAVYWWGGLFDPGIFRVVLQFLLLAAGSGLLVVNGLFLQNRLARFLAHPIWYPFARVSYGIYLVHLFPIFWVLRWWPPGPHGTAASIASLLGFTATVVLLSALTAAVLFLVLERPMLDWGAALSQRYLPAEAPAGAAIRRQIRTDKRAQRARRA